MNELTFNVQGQAAGQHICTVCLRNHLMTLSLNIMHLNYMKASKLKNAAIPFCFKMQIFIIITIKDF